MIECTKFTPLEKGCLRGFADLYIPKWGVDIKGCSFYSKGQASWLNFPSKEFEKDGEKKYSAHLYFRERSHKEEFDKQAKLAISRYIEENNYGTNEREK